MVRFCSESLLVVPVFFSVVHLNWFLWKNLLQRPLDAAGLSALMSVVFGSDSAVLFIFLLHISVMTFYLRHSPCKSFQTAHHRSSLVLQVSWSRSWVSFCCPSLDMNFSTIFCSILIPICLPKSLSLQLLQHLPWQCPVSWEGPCLQCSPLQTRIKPFYRHSRWGQGDFGDHGDSDIMTEEAHCIH